MFGVGYAESDDSDSLKFSEVDPAWERVQTASARALTTPIPASPKSFNNPEYDEPAKHSLKDFLESYAEKMRKDKLANQIDPEGDPKDKKSWNLLDVQKNRYPTDDRKGWVTLDPVPWSISKVSRWKPKTTEAPWGSYHGNQNPNSWENDFIEHARPSSQYQYNKKPEPDDDNHKVFYISEKNPVVNRPFSRPFTVYDQSVQGNFHKPQNNYYKPQDIYTHHISDIITDNSPSNFPTENSFNRRSGQQEKPEAHPFLGDGEWVLLSTTRGYKTPRAGQKSINFRPPIFRTQKSVQLTVLPPLKNSKINMTTSHGGLLQVDSTAESVEQAHKKFQKQQSDKTKKKRKRPHGQKRKKKVIKSAGNTTVTTQPRSTNSSPVLAAVGTGVIPATISMFLPVINNRKRRRKREVLTTIDPNTNIEITLPRYY